MDVKMKVVAIQTGTYHGDYDENVEQLYQQAIDVIEKTSPDLIAFPELMTAPYFAALQTPDDKYFEMAEYIDGPTVNKFADLAIKTDTYILGTLFEKEKIANGSFHYYNTAFICGPKQGYIGKYRKVHVPKIIADDLFTDEKYYFEQYGGGGKEFPVFTLNNGLRLGTLICFDRSIPEAWKALSLQGVDIIIVPNATFGFRKDFFIQELQIRAQENNVYVLATNKAGEESLPGETIPRTHFGLSALINPFGQVVSIGTEEPFTYVEGVVEKAVITKSLKRQDWNKARRPDTYNF